MIRLRNIVIYGEDTSTLAVQYPEDMRFANLDIIEKYKSNLTLKWSEVFEQKVTIQLSYVEIPKDVNVMNICKATAKALELNLQAMFGKSRHPDLVQGRMFAVQIMLDAYIPPSHIEEQTPFKNRMYYYYRNKLSDLRDTEPAIDAKYKDVYDKVMTSLNN